MCKHPKAGQNTQVMSINKILLSLATTIMSNNDQNTLVAIIESGLRQSCYLCAFNTDI